MKNYMREYQAIAEELRKAYGGGRFSTNVLRLRLIARLNIIAPKTIRRHIDLMAELGWIVVEDDGYIRVGDRNAANST